MFAVATGRSGTSTLAAMAAILPDVTGLHEPGPNFTQVLRRIQLGHEQDLARRWWVELKLPRIASTPGSTYVETSNAFGKGFLEPLLELGYVPDLLIPRRSPRDVARSAFALGMVPGRDLATDLWFLRPDDPDTAPLEGWERLHDYHLCYWYALEMGRRQEIYGAMVRERGARTLEIPFEQLSGPAALTIVSEFLTGRPPSLLTRLKWRRKAPGRRNARAGKKGALSMPLLDDETLDRFEKEVEGLTGLPPHR